MTEHMPIFDRSLLVRRRDRAAAGAAAHDFLLRRVADDLFDRLLLIRRDFSWAADVGAHHGIVSRRLRASGKIGVMADLEASDCLLAQCEGPKVQAHEDALPFADGALDLVVSALSLHLVDDLPGALVQIRRALKPDGLFLGALLGGETLKELREAWIAAEIELHGGASPRVAPFAGVRALGGLLQRAGFALPVADMDAMTAMYASPLALMRDVKAMGASNMLIARGRRPVTRRLFFRAAEIYTERFASPDGRIPATFEIVTLTAWAPHESQQQPLKPGSAAIRLAEALGTAEHKAGEKTGRG